MQAGYDVTIAASGDPAAIALIVEIVVPGARAAWAVDAVRDADLVVLAVPLHRFGTVDPAMLAGRTVIDVMNYWAPVDGAQQAFEDSALTSSEVVQRRLAGARVVKAFNHIGYHEVEEHRLPAGAEGRQALGVAGDDAGARAAVAELIERIGYDVVDLGALAEGRPLQPGGPFFGARLTAREFDRVLGRGAGLPARA